MSKLISLSIYGFVCLMATACEFSPSALTGKSSPQYSSECSSLSAKMELGGATNKPNCAAVDSLITIDSFSSTNGKLEVSFSKLSDGTFPKLTAITYRKVLSGGGTASMDRQLTCAEAKVTKADLRTYSCYLLKEGADEESDTFQINLIQLANEGCGATAYFSPHQKSWDCSDYSSSSSYSSISHTVYVNGFFAPVLSPIEKPAAVADEFDEF